MNEAQSGPKLLLMVSTPPCFHPTLLKVTLVVFQGFQGFIPSISRLEVWFSDLSLRQQIPTNVWKVFGRINETITVKDLNLNNHRQARSSEQYGNFLLLYMNSWALMIDGQQIPPQGVPHTRQPDIWVTIEALTAPRRPGWKGLTTAPVCGNQVQIQIQILTDGEHRTYEDSDVHKRVKLFKYGSLSVHKHSLKWRRNICMFHVCRKVPTDYFIII